MINTVFFFFKYMQQFSLKIQENIQFKIAYKEHRFCFDSVEKWCTVRYIFPFNEFLANLNRTIQKMRIYWRINLVGFDF